MVIKTTKFYILITVWMTLTFSQGHICLRKLLKSVLIFSQISQSIWLKRSMFPQPVGLLRFRLNTFRVISVQGRELYSADFVRYTLNIDLHSEAYQPISFKLGLMIDTSKLDILIPVYMTLTFNEGHRVIKNLECVHFFYLTVT